jgi:G:T-mismatch repair DNA endonuclease (very short patch repair protein)
VCRGKANRGKISPKRNGKTVCCVYCGKKVYRARWRLEQYKYQYCSRLCMNKDLICKYIRPTKPEKKFMELINKYNLPYRYVGDGKFWIDNKNPDFIHTTKKEVVEVFGDYWHNPTLNKHCKYENTEEGRHNVFKSKGYNCIIIWEKELNMSNWEENVLKKLGENYANICCSSS